MIVDVFDLTGGLVYTRYEISEEDALKRLNCQLLRDVLIIPPNDSNCRAYLQNPNKPITYGLEDEQGCFAFEKRAFLLQDFLDEDVQNQNWEYVRLFFECTRARLYKEATEPDQYIILIPDNYSAATQEHLLRNSGFLRKKTVLLWRSIAICLAKEKQWVSRNLKEGDEILVVDYQQKYIDRIPLLLKNYKGKLIPQRKSFRNHGREAHVQYRGLQFVDTDNRTSPFYTYVYRGLEGNHLVWDGKQYQQKCVRLKRPPEIEHEKVSNDLTIFHQLEYMKYSGDNEKIRTLSAVACKGAAIFAQKNARGEVAYYDQCDGLYIVVQDRTGQKVYLETLIKADECCRGGEKIKGKPNDRFYIENGSESCNFYLSEGKHNDKLKELIQDFKSGKAKQNQRLHMEPSMIPGQGIAEVNVTGHPLIQDVIKLELLSMNETSVTLKELQDEMNKNLAYPVDMPSVAASRVLWENIRNDVKLYCKGHSIEIQLNKGKYRNLTAKDISRFERDNVFGRQENRELPCKDSLIDKFFEVLKERYAETIYVESRLKVLKMIAWTFQFDRFKDVKTDLINSLHCYRKTGEYTLRRRKAGKQWKVLVSAWANLLNTDEEISVFVSTFLSVVEKKIKNTCVKLNHLNIYDEKWGGYISRVSRQVEGTNEWLRALFSLLVFNNDMLRAIRDEECRKLMISLIYVAYSRRKEQHSHVFQNAFKCMIFILKRRCYSSKFLTSGRDFNYIKEILAAPDLIFSPYAENFKKFLEGKGTLEGIPIDDE